MKTRLLSLIAALCLGVVPATEAQNKGEYGASTAPVPKRLETFNASGLYLRAAVAKLQETLAQAGHPAMNVLFGPGTEKLEIGGDVVLRNVSGPDALQLIAAAANCVLEPMGSATGEDASSGGAVSSSRFGTGRRPPVIGYVIRAQSPPVPVVPGAAPAVLGMAALPGGARPLPVRTIQTGQPPNANEAGGNGAGSSPRGHLTRVYSLAGINAKQADLEEALRDILKLDGTGSKEVTLSLHEKLNVLVVNAPENVHVLVDQLMVVLERNAQAAQVKNNILEAETRARQVEQARRAEESLAQLKAAKAAAEEQMKAAAEAQRRAAEEAMKRALQEQQKKAQDAPKKKTGEP